jgi:hypothetical protein
MYIVLAVGITALVTAYLLPQKNTSDLLRRIWRAWSLPRVEKYRIDLPQSERLLWFCSIEIDKTPIVLDERNVIILSAIPLFGDQHEAHVDIPITSTEELNEITVKAVSSSLDFEEKSIPSFLSITGAGERRFIVSPKVLGEGKLRFEFWHRGILRGIVEHKLKVKSKQYGPALPAGVALCLKIGGLSLSVVGAVMSVLKLLHVI